MISFIESFLFDLYHTSIPEWLGVIFGTIYLILLTRKNIFCWYFALASSLLYVYLCFIAHLYLETLLQLFYAVMAIVGWYMWYKEKLVEKIQSPIDGEKTAKPVKIELPIREWALKYHLINIGVSAVVALTLGYIFANYTQQSNPYVDAFTTVFSLTTTYMVAKRVLTNWIYWIVIDFVGIFLYYERGYSLTSVLYLIYTFMAITGFVFWKKEYEKQKLQC